MSICRNRTTNCQSLTYGGDIVDHHRTLAVGLTEIAALHIPGHILDNLAERLTLEIGTIGNTHEIEEHLLLLEHDLLNTQLLAQHTEGHHIDKFLGHIGDGAKTVGQALAIGMEVVVEMVAVGQIVEFAIEQHTLRVAGDILLGEIHLDVGLEGTVIDETYGVRETRRQGVQAIT